MPEQDIIYLALAVCNVLKILHGKNIIHRDIKPANFLITNDGKIKLIDFDAARIVKDHKKQDTKYLGTEGYAPPEQYGFSQTDCRSDIYALGITIKDLVGKNYKGKLLNVIDKCTKVNPDQRFQSAEELERGLKNIQKSVYIKYTVAFVCLIAFILGGGWFYMYKSQPSLTESTSSVQSDISNIKVTEQPDSKVITADTEQKEQTEVREKEVKNPTPAPKESVQGEKSNNKSANEKATTQNTPAAAPQATLQPTPVEQKQSQQIQKKTRKVSRGEIDAYFQLSGMDRLRFNDNVYEDYYSEDANKIFSETKGEIANDFPGSLYIKRFEYLNIEITNLSDEELRNAWVRVHFGESDMAIPPSTQKPSKVCVIIIK